MARTGSTAHRSLALTVAVLAGVVVSACGSGGSLGPGGQPAQVAGSSAVQSVAGAARRTLALTASVSLRLDGSSALGGARAPVFGQGSFDFPANEGTLLLDLPEAAHQEHGNEHAILFPTLVYLQPKGTSAAVLPRGKAWMSATIAGSDSVTTNFPQFVGTVEGVNPVLGLSELAWGATSAQRLGEELISGVPAQHYRVSVDLARALTVLRGQGALALGAAIQQQLTSVPSHGSGAAATSVPLEVWIDRTGRVIEYRSTFPGTGDGTTLIQMRSFGARVQVRAPAAGDVVDITQLTPSGERENNGGGDSDGG